MKTIELTGIGGGRIGKMYDLWVNVPAKETYRVQEEHIKFYHRLCLGVENHFLRNDFQMPKVKELRSERF